METLPGAMFVKKAFSPAGILLDKEAEMWFLNRKGDGVHLTTALPADNSWQKISVRGFFYGKHETLLEECQPIHAVFMTQFKTGISYSGFRACANMKKVAALVMILSVCVIVQKVFDL